MKRIIILLLIPIAVAGWMIPPDDEVNYHEYTPVLMTRDNMENAIAYEEARSLKNPGKIYFKDNYIFINERYKGIHIINNQDPENPVNIGFIKIPGCVDMAMKHNTLYVDNAVDLVTIDLSGFPSISVCDRENEVFPELLPPNMDYLPDIYSQGNRPANTIIVGWEKEE